MSLVKQKQIAGNHEMKLMKEKFVRVEGGGGGGGCRIKPF